MFCDVYAAQFTHCSIGNWIETLTAFALAVALGLVLGFALGVSRFTQ